MFHSFNWVTYRWPPDYEEVVNWQWEKVVIPYWQEAAKFARQHGVKRIALEMHPGFVVYNPFTLLKLREAVGEESERIAILATSSGRAATRLRSSTFSANKGPSTTPT